MTRHGRYLLKNLVVGYQKDGELTLLQVPNKRVEKRVSGVGEFPGLLPCKSHPRHAYTSRPTFWLWAVWYVANETIFGEDFRITPPV